MEKPHMERRKFIRDVALGSSAVLLAPAISIANDPKQSNYAMTIQDVIDLFLKTIPNAPFPKTVDTIKSGDPNQAVKGIVTTMFATIDVIEKTAKAGANFIIAHEPTFYNHLDDTSWLQDDEVFQYKEGLLKKYNIVVWRCHDYIHAHKPDGVLIGVLEALGWEKHYDPANPYLINIEATSLQSIIQLAKKNMRIEHLKYIGDLSQSCGKIALAPGAAGGRAQIDGIRKYKPDLLMCGELNEWETSEYVRDMRAKGSTTSLVVLGHIVSEEPGLQWMLKWLKEQVPEIKVTHIPSGDAFQWA